MDKAIKNPLKKLIKSALLAYHLHNRTRFHDTRACGIDLGCSATINLNGYIYTADCNIYFSSIADIHKGFWFIYSNIESHVQ